MKSKRILIIDQLSSATSELIEFLKLKGYEILLENKCHKPLETIFMRRPDLILLDIDHLKIDGIEICKRLKSSSVSSDIPLIIITGKNSFDDRIRSLKSGANDCIAKPFEADELFARIETHLRQASPSFYSNTLTELPGFGHTIEYFERLIEAGYPFFFFLFKIENFILFCANSPAELSSDLLLRFSHILMEKRVKDSIYISHISDDLFVYILSGEDVLSLNKDSFSAEVHNSYHCLLNSIKKEKGDLIYSPKLKIKIFDSREDDIRNIFNIEFILYEALEEKKP